MEELLFPDFIEPSKWRDKSGNGIIRKEEWKLIRKKILERDDYTCRFCGIRWEKYQIVDHINGIDGDVREENLRTLCQLCNLIRHAGMGCVIREVVDLYETSKYSQNEIMKITWRMRLEKKSDEEIIKYLGLKKKKAFKMDKAYLNKLFGFVTSKEPKGDDMLRGAYKYYGFV